MVVVVWESGAFRVRRRTLMGKQYLDVSNGTWWYDPNTYTAFSDADAAEQEWRRSLPRVERKLRRKVNG